jgi:serine O-acetyltransferase
MLLFSDLRCFIFGSAHKRALMLLAKARMFRAKGYRRLSRYFFRRLERDYGVFINPKSQIGEGLRLPHPNGIIIGEGVVIGDNVTLYQQVTLGGARIGDWQAGRYPTIGHNTVIFAGAKIIGDVTVGDNCVIGANAVVTKDVPDNHTAVGIPARIIANKGSELGYTHRSQITA